MAGGSRGRLTREEVENLLSRLKKAAPRAECWSCECLRGFVAQVEMDCGIKSGEAPDLPRADPAPMHGCLGCEPCPPAEMFAEYLMRKRTP